MARVHVVHWSETEAEELIARLRQAGHQVSYRPKADSSTLRELRASPPDAVVIDLSRLPSHGREFAVALRASKATRNVPLVFHGGQPAKIEAIRSLLPDAVYAETGELAGSLKRAMASPTAAAVVPKQMMDRFASRTAAQKLGIQAGASVALVDAPRNYIEVLGALPADVRFEEGEPSRSSVVTLWFVQDVDVYRANLGRLRETARHSKFWVLWRKGRRDLKEPLICDTALEFGLVDYKVCSVDPVWSGLLFAYS